MSGLAPDMGGDTGGAPGAGAAAHPEAVLAETARRLAANPADVPALLARADALLVLGREREAARHYGGAVRVAGPPARWPAALAPQLHRAAAMATQLARRFGEALTRRLAQAGALAASPRFAEAIDLLLGRAQVMESRPSQFLFPGLAAIPFHDRALFPWMAALEAAAPAIRAELLPQADDPAFAPYVEADAVKPGAGGTLVGDAAWSALYLVRDGHPTPHAARFPATMAALAELPLCDVPGRTPNVLFSRLAPGARIPPHHGFVNTRLIVHLGLVVPEGCWLRVGNHRRPWREGEAWAFDDTIEHEAANDSGETRIILLFDIWRPELSEAERGALRAMFAAIDALSGEARPGAWGG
ncbi:MAG: aspartyl/asparaginyl beta-hydroxylase domain-containing protein [Sphingomonadaceae bacterium]